MCVYIVIFVYVIYVYIYIYILNTWKTLEKWHLYNHLYYYFVLNCYHSILMATCEDIKCEKIMASFSFNKHLWITCTYYGIVP